MNSLGRIYTRPAFNDQGPPKSLEAIPIDAMTEEQKQKILKMRDILQQGKGWDGLYAESLTPWDNGQPQPALLQVLEHPPAGFEWPKSGNALVAGCGRGYDPFAIAQKGYETWGVDISPLAVADAEKWASSQPNRPKNLTYKVVDFFNFDLPSGQFQIAYDYTFFCALDPSMRPAWGQRYKEVVASGGYLVAICFPMDGDRQGGPPYSLNLDLYHDVLGDAFELLHQVKTMNPLPGHADREIVTIWRRS